jgi:N-acetylglucosamine-6-sulfatase
MGLVAFAMRVTRRHAIALLSASLIVAPALASPGDSQAASSSLAGRPNIVVFYLDDVNPHDGRLWKSSTRTPTIYRRFVARGIRLPNAITENPLCCPARANLLTGLHTHNNGVATLDGRTFEPAVHIGRRLRDAGYASLYIGKYLNKANLFTATDWAAHSAGWSYFDVIKAGNGRFYNYTLYTKGGPVSYGSDPEDHSTQMVADRAVMRFRRVRADKPIFAMLSIYNLHKPNTPMPRFRGAPSCAGMPPWKPPSYNEADVSDKPAWVRNRSLLFSSAGWPMVGHCEEMLGVDWAVKRVIDELRAQGRLDNTLLIFTADNGMGWGEHRLPGKRSPYATPVPLYMAWPARWGSERRVVRDHISNIDFAPTFCAIGGCQMGPYPDGQRRADGVNILPLLDGRVSNLGRDAVLERGAAVDGTLPWTALRTTASHPAGLWHYVEYDTGEQELYDLEADPWELQNLAYDPATEALRASLASRLAELRREGRVAGS